MEAILELDLVQMDFSGMESDANQYLIIVILDTHGAMDTVVSLEQ